LSKIAYRPEIDGLRAIAVISVVLFHAGIGPAAGFAGVDVFFVISGYLITSLLHEEWAMTGRIDLFGFYARRVRRIFPALIVVVIGTVATSSFLLSPFGEQLKVTRSAAASLLFVANFFFQLTSGGYFDGNSALLPLLHLWSLAVEEQFYLLWPLALLLLLRRPKLSLPVLAVVSIASLTLAEVLLRNDPSAAFYQMPARFWELAFGGMVALLPPGQLRDGRLAATAGVLAVLAGVAIPDAHFPGLGALPAVAGSALLIYAIHGSSRLGLVGAWLRSRLMVFVGLISYALYLWHWPLLAIDRATRIGTSPLCVRLLLIGCAVALAWLSYRFVEKPCRLPDPKTSNRKLVLTGLATTFALALFVTTLGNSLNQVHHAIHQQTLSERTAQDMPANTNRCHYPQLESLAVFPKPNCNSVAGKSVRVVIWGDSHALAWEPLAWALAQHDGVAAVDYTRDACPPALGYMTPGRTAKAGELCKRFNTLVIAQIKDVDTLILSGFWQAYLVAGDDPQTALAFKAELEATLQQVLPHVKRIIVLGPTPRLRDSAVRCIEQSNLGACAIDRGAFDAQIANARKTLLTLVKSNPKVQYLDTEDFFCTAVSCPVLKDGYSLYWDDNHVSATAARRFAEHYLATIPNSAPHAAVTNTMGSPIRRRSQSAR
jgi:peptidoglycan/LPS O-acetylase OafA/YrhL